MFCPLSFPFNTIYSSTGSNYKLSVTPTLSPEGMCHMESKPYTVYLPFYATTVLSLLLPSPLSILFLPSVWCSEGWRGWNHNCYYFSQDAAPWTSAQAWCRSHLDSDLVSVASLEENTFILGMNKRYLYSKRSCTSKHAN